MKATLEFNLPEDHENFELAVNALNWKLFVIHMEQYLRNQWKYNEDHYTEDQYKVLVEIREKFYEILKDNELSLD